MALTLTNISTRFVGHNGGHQIELTGTFVLNRVHHVYVGFNGDANDAAAISPGRKFDILPLTPTLIRCYTPRLAIGGPYSVAVTDTVTDELVSLPSILRYLAPKYYTNTFEMRRVFPARYAAGARSIDLVK